MFEHLNLKDWPFIKVPDEEYCKIWADRHTLKESIEIFLTNIQRIKSSSIRMMWAYVGSGKSHTLMYIKHKCEDKYNKIYPVYLEFPKYTKTFLDLYKEIVTNINFENINFNNLSHNKFKYLNNYIKVMQLGVDAHKIVAEEWIKGNKISLKDLRDAGFKERIDNPNLSIKILTDLIGLILNSNQSNMCLIMIDEIQRIGELNDRQRIDINTCLHSLFNSLPKNLTMIFSFSVRQQDIMFRLISPELISRSDRNEMFELKLFSLDEATIFIEELLEYFKIDKKSNVPFSKEMIELIIDQVNNKMNDKYELKPRDLIDIFHSILSKLDYDFQKNKIKSITLKDVKLILDKLNNVSS